MTNGRPITFSAPGKIHLLGEHSVVYGKPALLATVNLRVTVTLSETKGINPKLYSSLSLQNDNFKKIIEPIVKKYLKIKDIPSYQLTISSQLPIGAGLGSSAAISACYIAALLNFLKVKWDLDLVNELTYEAEKAFHGNPSGADNCAVVFGGLIWFRKESEDLKIIQPLPFAIPAKLEKNFVIIYTGTPKQSTKEMVEMVSSNAAKFKELFDNQEKLAKELLSVLKGADKKELIKIIIQGEKNLESIGVVSKEVASIIRIIEKRGGAAKICGAGAIEGPTGALLCYHPTPSIIKQIAKSYNLDYFKTKLGTKGLRLEN
ncbi:mevalonate kinase [Candidatus Daviesbacteria bacterium]|nr:mevalonate kinase [Candidatus Daviesbacteria bacterium]